MIGSFRFSDFHNHIMITNDAGCYEFLTKQEFQTFIHESIDRNSELWKRLKNKFFCYDESEEVYLRNVQEYVQRNHAYLFSPTSLFILALTNRCNNMCIYCQAHGCASIADMDSTVLYKIIERISQTPASRINIEFQGGEPLLNFERIKETIKYSKELLRNKNVEFSLVSNLAYMNENIAEFICENNISVSTSLDGPKELHDFNRPTKKHNSSFDMLINGLRILRKWNIPAGAIQTTTRASLSRPRDIVRTYSEMGFNSIFLRPLTRLGAAAQVWDKIGYSPSEFIEFYNQALDEVLKMNREGIAFSEVHASILLSKILGGTAQNYMELRSPCGAGIGQMAFTANGDVYTCDEGRMLAEIGDTSFRLGNVFKNGYKEWIESATCKAVYNGPHVKTTSKK